MKTLDPIACSFVMAPGQTREQMFSWRSEGPNEDPSFSLWIEGDLSDLRKSAGCVVVRDLLDLNSILSPLLVGGPYPAEFFGRNPIQVRGPRTVGPQGLYGVSVILVNRQKRDAAVRMKLTPRI